MTRSAPRLSVNGLRREAVDRVYARIEAQLVANEARLGPTAPPAADELGIPESEGPDGSHESAAAVLPEQTEAIEPSEEGPADAPPDGVPDDGDVPLPHPTAWAAFALAGVAYLLMAAGVMSALIADPRGRYLSQGVQDQQQAEWFVGVTAHLVSQAQLPIFTTLQNYPTGVNLMANALVTGIGMPLTPLTLLAGPEVTFLVIEVLGLAGTALAWSWLFARWLTPRAWAAWIGGALCGFAPAMISHANGHMNFVVAFVLPLILDRMIVLARGGSPLRCGVAIGLLTAWQVLIGEEALFLFAGGVLFALVVLASRRAFPLSRFVAGMGVAALIALALVGPLIMWQFFGPQSYGKIAHQPGGNDLLALFTRPTRTLFSDPWQAARLSMNRTEENAFFGVGLWIIAVTVVAVRRREPLVQALALVIAIMVPLSLGPSLVINGRDTGIVLPWALLEKLPLLGSVIPGRLAMVAIPAFAALLVLGIEWVAARRPTLTPAWLVLVAVALLPLIPTPLVADERPPVPAAFAGDAWREWVGDGSVFVVPLPTVADARALTWQGRAEYGFPLVGGYFVGPGPDGAGQYGATPSQFAAWLGDIADSGIPAQATEQESAGFRADLQAARADVVVLPVGRPEQEALLTSVSSVLGPGTLAGGVYYWPVGVAGTQ